MYERVYLRGRVKGCERKDARACSCGIRGHRRTKVTRHRLLVWMHPVNDCSPEVCWCVLYKEGGGGRVEDGSGLVGS